MRYFAILLLIVSCFIKESSGFQINAKRSSSMTNLNLKNPFQSSSKSVTKPKYDTVVVPSDYRVPAGLIGISAAFIFGLNNLFAGIPIGLIGALLAVQAGRVRFVFDNDSMEVCYAEKIGEEEKLKESGQNFAVGGKNRWKYDTFTNWFFIPSKDFPILMYFKETQTSPKGQLHLFPIIMNGRTLYNVLDERVGSLKV